MRKPLSSIRVKAVKFDDGIVRVSLVDVPEHIKFARLKKAKAEPVVEKKATEKVEDKKSEKPEVDDDDDEEEEEKPKVEKVKEKVQVKQAKQKVSKDKGVKIQRKALSR